MKPVSRRRFMAAAGGATAAMAIGSRTSVAWAAGGNQHPKFKDQLIGGFESGQEGWHLNLGPEFPGAQGGFTRTTAAAHSGRYAAHVHVDFTKGGNYVGIHRQLPRVPLRQLALWVKTSSLGRMGVRLVDSTGQHHQYDQLPVADDPSWQRIVLSDLDNDSGHWAGADDGVWHGPAVGVQLLVSRDALTTSTLSGDVDIDDVVAHVPWPALEIEQTTLGNVFLTSERPSIQVTTTADSVVWTVSDVWGAKVGEGTTPVRDGTVALHPGQSSGSAEGLRPGYYTLGVTAHAADATVLARKATDLAVVPPFDIATVEASPFGIGTHFGRDYYSLDVVSLLAAAGVKQVRTGLVWSSIELEKGKYVFDKYDAAVAALRSAGIDVLPNLDYVNKYYDGGATPYTNEGRAGFAAYAAATMQHYAAQLRWAEVYNEFNLHFGDKGDGPANSQPSYYYRLLKATYAQIKSVYSGITVVGPATGGVPTEWLTDLFDRGGLNYLDAVSVHTYSYPGPPRSETAKIDTAESLLRSYGKAGAKPLWITEMGWPTNTGARGVSEHLQAAYLARSYALALSLGVEKYFWYDFVNDGTRPGNNEDNFGIVRNPQDARGRYVPKPAYSAYAAMTRQLVGATFRSVESVGEGIDSLRFAQGGESLRVVWATTPTSVTVKTPRPITVVSMVGDSTTYHPSQAAEVSVQVDGDPIYITAPLDASVSSGGKFALAGAASQVVGDPIHLTFTVAGQPPRDRVVGTLNIEGRRVPIDANPEDGESVTIPLTIPGRDRTGDQTINATLVVDDHPRARLLTDITVQPRAALEVKHVWHSGGDALEITVTDNSRRPLAVDNVVWQVGSHTGSVLPGATIPANGVKTIDVPLDLDPGRYPLDVTLHLASGSVLQQHGTVVIESLDAITALYERTTTVDGTLDALDSARAISLPADGTIDLDGYAGADDLSARLWFTWDVDNLYLSAAVTDNVQAQKDSGGTIWRGDSIQFALAPGNPGETNTEYEYGVALTPDGPQVYRWIAINGQTGPASEVKVAITRNGDDHLTTYELAIPWDELTPIKPADGMFSLAAIINDNDGAGRKGWIAWGGGIGHGKNPSLFNAVRLTS